MNKREQAIYSEFREAEAAADERLKRELARSQQEHDRAVQRAADHMNAKLEERPDSFVLGLVYKDANGEVWYYDPVAAALDDPKPWRLLVAMNVDAAGRMYGWDAPRRPLHEMIPREGAVE